MDTQIMTSPTCYNSMPSKQPNRMYSSEEYPFTEEETQHIHDVLLTTHQRLEKEKEIDYIQAKLNAVEELLNPNNGEQP